MAERNSDYIVLKDALERHGGAQALAAFDKCFAGNSKVRIPRHPKANSAIAKCIGLNVAIRVCKDLSVSDADGRPIQLVVRVPSNTRAKLRLKVLVLSELGFSVESITQKVGCSDRTVWRIIKEARKSFLPKPALSVEDKARIVVELVETGASVSEAARQVDITEAEAWRILASSDVKAISAA